jgi:putative nucleotidyltransferase with HDIG domain
VLWLPPSPVLCFAAFSQNETNIFRPPALLGVSVDLPLAERQNRVAFYDRIASHIRKEGNRMPSREDAWNLVCEYTQSESLRKHMLAVEVCVRAYARKNGADQELWGTAALLHDFDYERWPNADHAADREHPAEGAKILREKGYSEELIRAILSHAEYSGVARQSALEHTLFACDELAGFLAACAYVRPSKSILDLEVSSVKKRMKDKAFARGVSREDVIKGAEELGVPLDEHITFCIGALRENAEALGLRGSL